MSIDNASVSKKGPRWGIIIACVVFLLIVKMITKEPNWQDSLTAKEMQQVKSFMGTGPDQCDNLECAYTMWTHKNGLDDASKRRAEYDRQKRAEEIDAVARVGLCARDPNYCEN